MSQGVPHHTCTVHTPCQETPIAVAQPKSSDLPFKLFGTTIPVSDATLIISADQNSDRETNDESSRPPEDYNQVDEQGASFESSDGCEAKNSDKYLEEMEGKESRKAKRSSSVDTTDKMMPKKPDKLLPCPRCDSLETKFCYYNNYNVNQPRHFCKNCQRYWTAGGTLRNVPVGAGRRKNKHSTTLSHGTPFPNDINSDNPVQPNNSCFSIPIAMNHVHTDLSSSVISFGLDHNNTTYPTNGSEVLYKSPDRISGSPSKISTSGTSTSSPSSPWPNVCNGRWNSGNASWGTTLGKHPRYTQQPERSVLVPRTLRINDAKEASESSIWKSLRVEAKSDSFSSTGVFKAFQSKRIESTDSKHIYANSSSVQSINANPAAHTRSMSYQESS